MSILSILYLTVYLFTSILSGLEYQCCILKDPQCVVHRIKVDNKKYLLQIVAQMGKAQKTSDMCKQIQGACAINGGFFMMSGPKKLERLYQIIDMIGFAWYPAYPSHALKKDNEWISFSSQTIGFVGWKGDQFLIDKMKPNWQLKIGNIELPIKAFNNLREYDYGLFNHHIGRFIFLEKTFFVLTLKKGKLVSVDKRYGIMQIPDKETYLFCIPVANDCSPLTSLIKSDYVIKEDYTIPTDGPLRLQDCTNIIASTPLLIKDGLIVPSIKDNKSEFYTKKHPRSAIGILKNRSLLLVVVDGRSNESAGMTLVELAEYMFDEGCITALNLDGGGSSTMVLRDIIMNKPSGREKNISFVKDKERYLLEALVVTPKNEIF
jgi:uncharacterized protein YigE (DUF2233 family)